jgi:hypothetical protein
VYVRPLKAHWHGPVWHSVAICSSPSKLLVSRAANPYKQEVAGSSPALPATKQLLDFPEQRGISQQGVNLTPWRNQSRAIFDTTRHKSTGTLKISSTTIFVLRYVGNTRAHSPLRKSANCPLCQSTPLPSTPASLQDSARLVYPIARQFTRGVCTGVSSVFGFWAWGAVA